MEQPSGPPPSYQEANPSSWTPRPTHLEVPHRTRSNIPPSHRRSMEDETRPLPPNWIRQYDPQTSHQFFINTTSQPPRQIWHHPYDDEAYLSSLSSPERERIQGLHKVPSPADIETESSADDEAPEIRKEGEEHVGGAKKLGRKVKDKLTHSTHEERETKRQKRAEEEERLYRQHQHFRQQMSKAIQTGEPQLLGKDKDGKEVYIEPPYNRRGGDWGYGEGGYGYNPYSQGGPYGRPMGCVRPNAGYYRPYGMGYGGGYGLPLGVGAGLGGGLLLGGLLF